MSDEHTVDQQVIDEFRTLATELKGVKGKIETAMSRDDGVAMLEEQKSKIIEDILSKTIDPLTKRMDGVETKMGRLGSQASPEVSKKDQYKAAFDVHLRHIARDDHAARFTPTDEQKSLLRTETKALTVGTDTSGGYTVPDDYVAQMIDQNATEIDSIRPYSKAYRTSFGSVLWPTVTAHAAASDRGEGGTTTEDSTLAFGQVEIATHKMDIMRDVSHELVEDSAFDLSAFLNAEFGQAFLYREGYWFVSGSGAAGQPEGFINNATIQANYVAGGVSGSLVGTNLATWLPALLVKIKEPYWANAIFAMNRTTYGALLGLQDGESRSHLMPNPAQALPLVMSGRRIVILPSMPDHTTANAYPIIYGDFRRGTQIVDKVPMMMQVDPYSTWVSGTVRYKALRRVGFAVTVPEAFAVLKMSTT